MSSSYNGLNYIISSNSHDQFMSELKKINIRQKENKPLGIKQLIHARCSENWLLTSFAQWQYRNRWGSPEVRSLLVENYNQCPALLVLYFTDTGNFWRPEGQQENENQTATLARSRAPRVINSPALANQCTDTFPSSFNRCSIPGI